MTHDYAMSIVHEAHRQFRDQRFEAAAQLYGRAIAVEEVLERPEAARTAAMWRRYQNEALSLQIPRRRAR